MGGPLWQDFDVLVSESSLGDWRMEDLLAVEQDLHALLSREAALQEGAHFLAHELCERRGVHRRRTRHRQLLARAGDQAEDLLLADSLPFFLRKPPLGSKKLWLLLLRLRHVRPWGAQLLEARTQIARVPRELLDVRDGLEAVLPIAGRLVFLAPA